uniref:Sodium-coupled monocarboxylate transporter 1 n=1 Tax=Romanomermis culicivorax TaxID=13658 RepID=A0A915JPY4_ROMCU
MSTFTKPLSLSVGFYHGFIKNFRSKRSSSSSVSIDATTTKDILFGGGNLKVLPVAMSLVTTFMSAISLMGYPSEIYGFGTMFCYYGLMYFVIFPLAAYVFLPFLYKLRLPSAYQYLELRFDVKVRRCASLIFCLETVLYLAAGLYAPALALNSVMKIPLLYSIMATGLVCAVYTSVGGAITVVWTSVYQFLLIIAGLAAVAATGVYHVGSFSKIFEIANEGGRIDFNDFGFDPRIRHSFWSLMIGGTFTLLCLYCTNQMTFQRYVSMSTLKQAQIALLLNIPLNLIIISLYTLIGLILFASFYGCNPNLLGLIKKPDEILPFFVVHYLSYLKGLPGIFVSAIYAAGLSTVSSGLNSLSAVILEDYFKPLHLFFTNRHISESKAVFSCKCTSFVLGAVIICLAYLFTKINAPVLQIALSLFGIGGGPILGVFCLGMFFRRPNACGALIGMLISAAITSWIGLSPIFVGMKPVPLAFSVDRCSIDLNLTANFIPVSEPKNFSSCLVLPNGKIVHDEQYRCDNFHYELYKLSYQYYSILAVFLAVFAGYLASLAVEYICPNSSYRNYDAELSVNFRQIFGQLKSREYCLSSENSQDISLKQTRDNKCIE